MIRMFAVRWNIRGFQPKPCTILSATAGLHGSFQTYAPKLFSHFACQLEEPIGRLRKHFIANQKQSEHYLKRHFHISRVTFFFEESSEKREARSRFPLHNLS